MKYNNRIIIYLINLNNICLSLEKKKVTFYETNT